MSNTGLKNISQSLDAEGNVLRHQVVVQWRGKIRRATIWADDLEAARILRDEFERELNKPRTEVRILPGKGYSFDARRHVNGSAVVTAYAAARGKRRRTNFSIAKHGTRGAVELAKAWRERVLAELTAERGRRRRRR